MAQKPIDKARNQGTERGTTQQKVLDELNQGTPAGIPQRVATNTDPTKPVTPKQLEPIAAANSNEAVKPLNQGATAPASPATPATAPQGLPMTSAGIVANEIAATFDAAVAPRPEEMTRSELDAYRQQKGLTPEQKKEADAIAFKWMEGSMPQQKGQFPGAVDPNSAQYAQNQQSTYQALTQRAATQGLTTSEKASMLGGDFAYRIGQGTPGMPGTSIASRLAASQAGAGTKAATAIDTKFQEYLGDNLEKFNQLPAAKQKAIKSSWIKSATKAGLLNQGATATPATPAPAVGGSGIQGLPGSGSPATAQTVSGGTTRDEKMLRTAQDPTASPQAREQAMAYINVKRMYANPQFAEEKKAFQQAERNWLKTEANFFKNHLNRKDPRYKDRYQDYRNFQRGDARTKLMVYTELLKHPRFASLGYK